MPSKDFIKHVTQQLLTAISKAESTLDTPSTNPIVIGSAGLMFLGVDYPAHHMPNDIDIAVSNMCLIKKTMRAYEKASLSASSPFLVAPVEELISLINLQYQITNKQTKESIIVQFINQEDFGLSLEKPGLIDNIPTLSPKGALHALLSRKEHSKWRRKDQFALLNLFRLYKENLDKPKRHLRLDLQTMVDDYVSLSKPDKLRVDKRLLKPPRTFLKSVGCLPPTTALASPTLK